MKFSCTVLSFILISLGSISKTNIAYLHSWDQIWSLGGIWGKLCVWSVGGRECRGSSVTLGSHRGWLWVVNGRSNSREVHQAESHPPGIRSEWRCALCLYLFPWEHHERFLNKCSDGTAPPWERHWSPLFSYPVQLTLGKRKGGLLERGGGTGIEKLSAKCVILACILVRICTLMPHLLRKSTRDFWWLEVMIGLMFPFPPSCRKRPRFWEKNQWPPLAAWLSSSNFLRAEDKNHTSRHWALEHTPVH